MTNVAEKNLIAIFLAAIVGLAPLAAFAEPSDPGKATEKSERAMTPDSAKDGGSPKDKSERAMDKSAGQPGSAPNGNSERAMDSKNK